MSTTTLGGNFVIQALNESGSWVTLPTPAYNAVKLEEDKVWSANTGRDSTGIMQGTLIGIKRKVNIEWPPLTIADAETIRSVVANSAGFTSMKCTWVDGSSIQFNGYWGDAEFPLYSAADNISNPWQGVTCNFIER